MSLTVGHDSRFLNFSLFVSAITTADQYGGAVVGFRFHVDSTGPAPRPEGVVAGGEPVRARDPLPGSAKMLR